MTIALVSVFSCTQDQDTSASSVRTHHHHLGLELKPLVPVSSEIFSLEAPIDQLFRSDGRYSLSLAVALGYVAFIACAISIVRL